MREPEKPGDEPLLHPALHSAYELDMGLDVLEGVHRTHGEYAAIRNVVPNRKLEDSNQFFF